MGVGSFGRGRFVGFGVAGMGEGVGRETLGGCVGDGDGGGVGVA